MLVRVEEELKQSVYRVCSDHHTVQPLKDKTLGENQTVSQSIAVMCVAKTVFWKDH